MPFVAINCGAIPENLIESILFGHVKGSFTGAIENRKGVFEQAEGGAVFLDEIGELPLSMQVKLLRVLQEKHITRVGDNREIPVNVRVISATHVDLEEAVKEKSLGRSLFRFRLCCGNSPLGNRGQDVILCRILWKILCRNMYMSDQIKSGFRKAEICGREMYLSK